MQKMSEKEAIAYIERHAFISDGAKDMAITAIKEIQQYRAIGTLDECREAVERMKPKRIKNTPNDEFPTCGRFVMGGDHCRECGQKVDWGE